MWMLKLAILVVVAFLAAVGMFIGAVTTLTSLQNGSIGLAYSMNGKAVTETITRAADSARFWKLVLLMGLAPMVIGAGVLRYAVRRLKAA